MKSWLQDYDIEMHSTHNKIRFVVAQRFKRNCRIKSTNVYTDKLDDLVNECNNTYRRIIKIKPTDV